VDDTSRKPNRQPRAVRAGQRLLTGRQAEAETGVPYRSLYDLHVRGALPAVRFPGSRRLWFERDALDRLIERSREAVR
jgi:hypothetical protein